MTLNTCSEGISYARELEETSAGYYERLAQLFPEDSETFRGYAAANKKNVSNVERAYFGVITDALEGCFAFNIEPEDYSIDVDVPEGFTRAEALAKAIALEETMVRYYTDAAEQSKGLMADVPRAFMMVARKRNERVEELKARTA
jgi:rubrerythrin